jgi:hypothetical protein
MTNQHPITPPPELVQQWASKNFASQHLCNVAAQWGADQRGAATEAELQEARDEELEACLERILDVALADQLRAARRPKPPTLKEQALAALDDAIMRGDCITISDALPTLRRALEALPND